MFFSKSFLDILENLSHEVYEKDLSGDDPLYVSIQAWCQHLSFSDDFSSSVIDSFRKQNLNSILNVFLRERDNSSSWPWPQRNPDVSNFIGSIEGCFARNNRFIVKFYLLAAFVVVSVAYTFSKVDQLKQQEKRFSTKVASLPSITAGSRLQNNKKFLILVISSRYEEIIRYLKNNNPITPDIAEHLYQATQELWIGTEQEYMGSPISNNFGLEQQDSTSSFSEYDVYFIKIGLSESDRGFLKNASQLSRLDAFTRLPQIKEKVEVSARLPSKSYENIGVYSR